MSARKTKKQTSIPTVYVNRIGYQQKLYTIQVSEEMLKYVRLMAEDPRFRTEVDRLIKARGYPLF